MSVAVYKIFFTSDICLKEEGKVDILCLLVKISMYWQLMHRGGGKKRKCAGTIKHQSS